MIKLRLATRDELPALSALCLRSKAHWGYDEAFIAACERELSITEKDLEHDHVWVAESDLAVIGVLQVQAGGEKAALDKLFIDPGAMGLGAGRCLFKKAVEIAKEHGAKTITIDADPGAENFYLKMGAHTVGRVASTVIEGRSLPFMHYNI